MFGFLKEKLKKVASVFTKATTAPDETATHKELPTPPKHVETQESLKKKTKPVTAKKAKSATTTKPVRTPAPQAPKPAAKTGDALEEPAKRSLFDKMLGRKKSEPTRRGAAEITAKPATSSAAAESAESPVETRAATEGFFGKLKSAITTRQLGRQEFESMWNEMELELLENNVALQVADKLKEDLWTAISTERFSRFGPEKRVQAALTQSISELFAEPFDILAEARHKDPYVIVAVGVNGSGKTTTLAKLAKYFKDNKLEPVLAAGDTFRAAAIQQLEAHAERIGVKIIKQQYGADAAAVAFDAVQYAKSGKAKVVLIDTAGRLHSNTNLMEELKKIVRVAKPDRVLFIGEATTGNDCVEQAMQFQHVVNIDGIVLSKVDVDERGGAAISISYVTKRPIVFFGTGQEYKDLQPFEKSQVMASLEIA